jgi:hypothetical protein
VPFTVDRHRAVVDSLGLSERDHAQVMGGSALGLFTRLT